MALAIHIVSVDFDATSVRVFSVCAQHGASGVPLSQLQAHVAASASAAGATNVKNSNDNDTDDEAVSLERAVGRLWRHGLVEYQHIALAHQSEPDAASDATTSSAR